MSAIYLHNAVYSQNSPEAPSAVVERSRNLSTLSGATLHTSTTLHSQPIQPLLHRTISNEAVVAYYEQLSCQPRNADGSPARLQWNNLPANEREPGANVNEKGTVLRRKGQRPWRRRRRVKYSLQTVLAAWAIYNTVRYFLAFVIYERDLQTGQILSLSAGICTGVAFALTFISVIVERVVSRIDNFGIVYRRCTRICSFLHYVSSTLLFSPSLLNFVMVFLWRNSGNLQYNLHHRCHFDIDVIWSVTNNCTRSSPSWTIWLIVSAIRVALTLLILVAYHVFAVLYPEVPQRPVRHRIQSGSVPFTAMGSSLLNPHHPTTFPNDDESLRIQNHLSDTSLEEGILRGEFSRAGFARSRSSGLSADSSTLEAMSFGRKGSDSDLGHDQPDRFTSILSRIAQETEGTVDYARSDSSSLHDIANNLTDLPTCHPNPPGIPTSYSQDNDEQDNDENDDDAAQVAVQFYGNYDNIYHMYNLRPIPPALGYNEFGIPYPPDENIPVLGSYIRRMPTIESMGSGEIATSLGTSSIHRGESVYTSSRPPTRNTLLSFNSSTDYEMSNTSSVSPSRPSSLSARAELLVNLSSGSNGISEHGELLSRPESGIRRVSSPSSLLESPTPSPTRETHLSTTGTRATGTTYHTAVSYFSPYLDTNPLSSRGDT